MIHIVTGLPGSGKTSVSKILEKKLDAIVINTDEICGILFPDRTVTVDGDFTDEQLTLIYKFIPVIATFLVRVMPLKHIIFDGSFRLDSQRVALINAMKVINCSVSIMLVKANESAIKERISKRYNTGLQLARYETYKAVEKQYETPSQAWVIDNSGAIGDLESHVQEYISHFAK